MKFPKDPGDYIDLSKITVEQLVDIMCEFFDDSLADLKHAASNQKFDVAQNILKNMEAWDIILGMIARGGGNFIFKWKEMKDEEKTAP